VGLLQGSGVLPKNANWSSVTVTTSGLPDEVMAVAASYDDTMRYGAQTPFSDQLAPTWEGGMWEFDPYHDSIISVGNGGPKPTRAAFTIFYNQGANKYELEQTLQPDEQMWIDVGKLIREHVSDKNGNVLPADLTTGSYEFRDLTDFGIGNLFEGKIIYDKTYGHVAYGCAICCGFSEPGVAYNPLGIPLSSTAGQDVLATQVCGGTVTSVGSYFYGNWTTQNTGIATVDYYGTHTGVSTGSTLSRTNGYLKNATGEKGKTCPTLRNCPSGNDNVQMPARLVFFNTSCAPNGQGPLQVITNGSVVDCGEVTRASNFCGVNRNLTYQLVDQTGAPFLLAYTLSESFSNLITTNSALGLPTPSQNVPIPANGIVTDAQFVGFTNPKCLGSNDHHSYTQNFSVKVGGVTYNLSTTVSISNGKFSGAPQDNVSITTP
jgi:hypothetical protein